MSFLSFLFKKGSPVTDPVCGMGVDPAKPPFSSIREGTTYSFCSKRCKEAFDADPARYVAAAGADSETMHGHHG